MGTGVRAHRPLSTELVFLWSDAPRAQMLDDVSGLPLPRTVLPAVVTLAGARELGLSPEQVERRVRAGVWTRLADAVFCTRPPAEQRDLIRGASLHAAPHGMLTGAGGLVAHGFARVPDVDRPTVLVPYRSGIRSTPSIQVRRAAHLPDAVILDGLRVAPVERAVVDHAMTLRWRDDVRAVLARAVQHHGVRPEDLDRVFAQVATRGSKLAREAVAEITSGARSAPEAAAAGLLVAGGIGGFVQNAALTSWGLAFVADFLWPTLRAVLEIDSVAFHFDDRDYQATLDRASLIKSRGLDTLHVSPRMITQRPEAFVGRTRRWLETRATLLGVTPPFTS